MSGNDIERVQVDLGQLEQVLISLMRCEDVLFDPAEPIGPGSFRGLDGVGALGPVHDADGPVLFDRGARRSFSTLEALLAEHLTMLRQVIDNISAARNRYSEVEPMLTGRFNGLIAELGAPPR